MAHRTKRNYRTSSKNGGQKRGTGTLSGWTWLLTGLVLGALAVIVVYNFIPREIQNNKPDSENLEATNKLALAPFDNINDIQQPVAVKQPQKMTKKENKSALAVNENQSRHQNQSESQHETHSQIPLQTLKPRFEFYTMLPDIEVPTEQPKAGKHSPVAINPSVMKPPALKPPAIIPPAKNELVANSSATDHSVSNLPAVKPLTTNQSATKTPLNSLHFLQLGSFINEHEAEALKASLNLQGYETHLKSVNINGSQHYRLLMGPFATQAEANAMRKKLTAQRINSIMQHDSA
jgi:cell division protein FtsN